MIEGAQSVQNLRLAIDKATKSGKLNDWETRFVSDMNAKLARYGTKARLSNKQEAKLRQVLKPYLTDERAPPSRHSSFVTSKGAKAGRSQGSLWRSQNPVGTSVRSAHARSSGRSRRPYRRYKKHPWLLRIWRRDVQTIYVLAAVGIVAVFSSFDAPRDSRQSVSPTSTSIPQVQTLRLTDFNVTDGDTIQLRGQGTGTRLIGFNTPETFEPVCEKGHQLGLQATERLKDLVQTASVIELQIVACACKPGTQGTSRCNFGRSCGVLRVDGRDVGRTLISEGLAAPFNCGRTSCPPTPRPWCQ
jgi:hypothetical protein